MNAESTHQDDASPTVIYMHIPKTAGLALIPAIRSQYPAGAVYYIDDVTVSIDDFRRLPADERARFRCVAGHVAHGFHGSIPRPCTYVTLLRDPVDRVISYYYYVKQRGAAHPLFQPIEDSRASLLDFARGELGVDLRNGQARYLSGMWGLDADSRQMGATAMRNVSADFAAVGFVERMRDSIATFERILGWRIGQLPRTNVTRDRPSRDQLDRRTIARIEEYNALDMEIYEWCLKRLEPA